MLSNNMRYNSRFSSLTGNQPIALKTLKKLIFYKMYATFDASQNNQCNESKSNIKLYPRG